MDEITREFPADAGAGSDQSERRRRAAATDGFIAVDRLSGSGAVGDPGDAQALPDLVDAGHMAPTEGEGAMTLPQEVQPAASPAGQQGAPPDAPIEAAVPMAPAVSDAEARAALAAAEDTMEIDESVVAAEDGLPPVPELADAAAIARIAFVLLLTQREGLSLLRLAQACNTTQKQVEQALVHLQQQFATMQLPVELQRHGDCAKVMSLPEAFPFLQRLRGVKKLERLSPAALETLAVIAYRQPVMRAEIEAIRGVKAGPMLRTLLAHKLVRVTGRADVPGRPLQYGTTQQFLDRFGLESLQSLPSLKEWQQLG